MNLGAIIGEAVLGDTELGNLPDEDESAERVLYPNQGDGHFISAGPRR